MIELYKRIGRALLPALCAVLGAGLLPGLAAAAGGTGAQLPAASNAAPQPATLHKVATSSTAKKKASGKKKAAALRKTKRHSTYTPPRSVGEQLGLRKTPDELDIRSSVALVVDQRTGEVLYAKNPTAVLPIASLTKLMTALIVVESGQPLDEVLEISSQDVDTEKHSQSRLAVGSKLTREDLLVLALMSSENRAASALGRHYPGGLPAFVTAMNRRAHSLGMKRTTFSDPTGLSPRNTSTAEDLVRLTDAVSEHALIREFSTRKEHTVRARKQLLQFGTSNRLIRTGRDWDIGLQKTGFTNEAGRCLIMQATVDERPLAMVFLDSTGTLTRYGDAARVRRWLQQQDARNETAYDRAAAAHSAS